MQLQVISCCCWGRLKSQKLEGLVQSGGGARDVSTIVPTAAAAHASATRAILVQSFVCRLSWLSVEERMNSTETRKKKTVSEQGAYIIQDISKVAKVQPVDGSRLPKNSRTNWCQGYNKNLKKSYSSPPRGPQQQQQDNCRVRGPSDIHKRCSFTARALSVRL